MTHRADQILRAIARVSGAVVEPKGVNVFVHRTEESLAPDQGELPADCVNYGTDQGDSTQYVETTDSLLEVIVTSAVVAATSEDLRIALLEMRNDVESVMDEQRKRPNGQILDLDFVHSIAWGSAAAPAPESIGELFSGSLAQTWFIHYEMRGE